MSALEEVVKLLVSANQIGRRRQELEIFPTEWGSAIRIRQQAVCILPRPTSTCGATSHEFTGRLHCARIIQVPARPHNAPGRDPMCSGCTVGVAAALTADSLMVTVRDVLGHDPGQ